VSGAKRHGDEARVLAAIDARSGTTLEEIRAAIRQPSISQTGEGLQAMADWVQGYLDKLGAEATQEAGERAPIVAGRLGADPRRPTLLFYDLYDTQPAAEQPGWKLDPFAAAIVAGNGRARLVGRGAFNSKGPLVGALAAMRAFREAGIELPVNVRFLIEGEEEIGSPSLPAHIARHRAELSACDAAYIPYFGTNARGETLLRLGFKGLVLLEFSVTGGAWGGPARADVHAWHGAVVGSPAWQLVRALATLVDERQRFSADGLAELIPPRSADDIALVAAAARRYDIDAYRAELGVERFNALQSAQDVLAALSFDCTLNIDALAAGRIEAGDNPATVVPRTARAFADLRLLPGMDPQAVVRCVRKHLDARGYGHVAINVRSAYPASVTPVHAPVVKAMVKAATAEAPGLTVLPIHAGAAPMHLFSGELGLPYAFGGVGHGGGAHGPNEYIMLDDIAPFMKTVARFLFRFAEQTTGGRA
jgi:acetylornithine deacetylase/succinyl-diaminopimelate desuccinylase-like protein